MRRMQSKSHLRIAAVAFALQAMAYVASMQAHAQAQAPAPAPYPAMAPVGQYMVADESAEVTLARSAAPASVSGAADVMVLRHDGYATAVKGTNGFVCIVERSWANTTDDAQFWNPRMRAPHCFNRPAAETVLPVYLMKSKMVLAGKSQKEIAAAVEKEPSTVGPGTMVYMMSKQQYLNDDAMSWHPHLMFFAPGDARESWGANLTGSPVMAAYDAEQRVTTFFVLTAKWSDDTPGPPMTH